MKPKLQLLFIALVIIVILLGEALVHVPSSMGGTVVIKSYPSTDALVQALTSGEVDVAPIGDIAPQALTQLNNDPNLNLVPIGNFGFTYIGFNLRNEPLNNSIFREAMLYGFDRNRVINDVLAGYGEALTPGLFSAAYAALGWRNDSVDTYPYNPQKASQLLDSIGFTQTSSGVRTNPSTGQQLRTMLIFSRLTDPQAVAAANLFAEDMQAIGLPVISFPETDIDYYSQTAVTYYFDLYIETVSASAAPTWLYNLFDGVNDLSPAPLSTNLVGYHSAAFDECAKQLMTANDQDSAKDAALTCQEQLSLDLPAIPVYSKDLLIAEQKGSLNIIPATGSVTETLADSLANMTAGNVITIGEVGGLSDINPATMLSPADALTLRLITAPLLTYNANGSLSTGLVDGWQMTSNNTILTLSVSSSFQFQDGTPTTAHDLAATLSWLMTNVLPSSPLYHTIKTITNVTEVDDHTISITLSQSNYFVIYEIETLFALPANLLPTSGGPLSLLLSGALEPSGTFALVRFVQGTEADLQSLSSLSGSSVPTISGVQGQFVSGFRIGGSQVPLTSQPLTYGGQSIGNATFTVHISDVNGALTIQGAHIGFGVYRANLNLNNGSLSVGSYTIVTELYGQLPTGVILQFGQQNLVIYPPQLFWQVIIYLLAIAALVFAFHTRRRVARRPRVRRRVRRVRPRRAKGSRRRRHSPG